MITMPEIEVYLPSLNGRLYITNRYPERNAACHVHSHVGVENEGTRNIEKTTPLFLKSGNVFFLTPRVKRDAIFFIMPQSDY
jgi:hypothetical protein